MRSCVNFRQWKDSEAYRSFVLIKTGTLTQNKMTVEDYYVDELCIKAEDIDLNDPSQSRLLIGSMLCNDSKNTDGVEIGDPTETALINLGSKLGLDPEEIRTKYPRESENPFDSDRKLMSTKHTIEKCSYDDRKRCGRCVADSYGSDTDRF